MEVVVLNKGEDEKDYKGIDVKGKAVLTDGDVGRVHQLAVEKFGAIGIISDSMWIREPNLKEGELDDAMKYTSFWWYGNETPCWGFVLSPRSGRQLRRLIEKSKTPVKIHARVESKLYEGEMEDCIATIPGNTNEKVIVVAHICHPQPSANDNASGSGAAMEAARALHNLISSGILSKPRRSIVFTLVPEITGTYPWLEENEKDIPHILAALNLDMVGEKQELCGGPLIMERTPESCSSFVNSLIEAIYDEVKKEVKNLGGSASYPLFKHTVTPFSGGSDHYVYSDPTIGVACPMIIQWPDKFYHTSADTLDKVDPEMLRKVVLITACYAYTIANAGPEEALWVAYETASRERSSLYTKIQTEITKVYNGEKTNAVDILSGLDKKTKYWSDRAAEAIKSVNTLAPQDKRLQTIVEELSVKILKEASNERKSAEKSIRSIIEAKGWRSKPKVKRLNKIEKRAKEIIPMRIYREPLSTRQWVKKLSPCEREVCYQFSKTYKDASILSTLAVYWADGKRNLYEISNLVQLECGHTDTQYLLEYFSYLEKMGLIRLR